MRREFEATQLKEAHRKLVRHLEAVREIGKKRSEANETQHPTSLWRRFLALLRPKERHG